MNSRLSNSLSIDAFLRVTVYLYVNFCKLALAVNPKSFNNLPYSEIDTTSNVSTLSLFATLAIFLAPSPVITEYGVAV